MLSPDEIAENQAAYRQAMCAADQAADPRQVTSCPDAAQPVSYVWDETVRTRHEKVGKPGEYYETGTWVPAAGVVFTARASRDWIEASATVETVGEAREIAAQFAKSAGVKGGPVYGHAEGIRGYVAIRAKLSGDGSNKGANETGLRRYRSFARTAARLGYEIRYAGLGSSLTEDEFAELAGDQAPAVPGTRVRAGHPGDINDPERFPGD
jgi:hypothetical protein